MGEDETVDFESLKQTLVILNMDDYPIPVDTKDDIDRIFDISLEALHIMGFRDGFMHLFLYSEQLNCDRKEDDMTYELKGESYTASVYKVPDIALYMIRFGSNVGPGPINFMVISKPKRELDRVLHCLKSRHHNVVLVEPPPQPDELCPFSVYYLLENARLLDGGKPRFKELYLHYMDEYDWSDETYEEIKEDVSKTLDFSERIPTGKGYRTLVFWDAEDCAFPPWNSTPDEMYHSISLALVKRDFNDKITIWAYLDDDDKKGSCMTKFLGVKKTWASSIYFLPGGDKASRRIRMLNDIHLWIRDNPPMDMNCFEASLVLVADQFKDAVYYTDILKQLSYIHYDLLLVTPTLDINKPESPEWPGLLIDRGGYLFCKERSRFSQKPSPKQHEAIAAVIEEAPETHDTLNVNKLKSVEWPGRQIDVGPGWESSEEPCPKKHKANASEEETPGKFAMSRLCCTETDMLHRNGYGDRNGKRVGTENS